MTEIKLLPCPFCGSTNVAQGASRGSISVWCFCGSQGPSVPFPDECIDPVVPILKCHEAWNRRPTLSSAAVAKREPVAFVSASAIRHHNDSGTSQTGTVLHREQGELYGEKHLALYLDPPPTSELEAENARLREERDEWAHVAGEQATRLAEALKALDEIEIHTRARPEDTPEDDRRDKYHAHRAARRVREGGKEDG